MESKKVVVCGGGVLGNQIAFVSAYWGYDTTIWLRSQGSIGRTKPKLEMTKKMMLDDIDKMEKDPTYIALGLVKDKDDKDYAGMKKKVKDAFKGIKLELDLAKAVKDAYIVVEAMSENVKDKKAFFQKLAPDLGEKTILVTNSSTLLPSKFAKYTKCPDRFAALHFANHIWQNNTAEVEAQPKTSAATFDEVMAFSKSIHMIALPLHKEKNGYLLNSMLVPFLFAGLDLYATGISDPKSIDTAWKVGTGAPEGPFEIMDVVGLKTVYEIVEMYVKIPSFLAPYHFKDMARVIKEMIDQKKLGRSSGEGFYKYSK